MKKKKEKEKKASRKKINYVATSSIKTMDFTIKNRIRHMLQRYNIENSATNFNKLAEVIHEKNIIIYQVILNLVSLCIIIHGNSYCLKIEIEIEKNKNLLEDIEKLFFVKIHNRRPTDFRSKLFLTVLIYKF